MNCRNDTIRDDITNNDDNDDLAMNSIAVEDVKQQSLHQPSQPIDNAEAEIWASMDATLQMQDDYEQEVLKQAADAMIPRLSPDGRTVCGFPSLRQELPVTNIQVIYRVLHQLRREMASFLSTTVASESATSVSASSWAMQEQRMLQEQILLSLLSELGVQDLPLRRDEDKWNEQYYSSLRRFYNQHQREQQHDDDDERPLSLLPETFGSQKRSDNIVSKNSTGMVSIMTTGDVGSNDQEAGSTFRKPPRIPIMIRRKMMSNHTNGLAYSNHDDEGQEDAGISQEQKDELRKLRVERRKRRIERKKLLDEWNRDNGTDGEEGHEFQEAASEDGGLLSVENEDTTGMIDNNKVKEDLICPLCETRIPVDDPSQGDAILSRHMDRCQRQRRSSRRTRGTIVQSLKTEMKSFPIRKVEDSKPKARKRKQDRISPPLAQSVDDLEDWVYQDRIDDWIEQGLARMKEMKERDAFETLPGAETLEGGLYIPAWINDRLFGYQREGLQWMWELHRQQLGGIIGDEMGLGKTVQVCAFLGVLAASRKLRSAVIVAPATMLQHWLSELRLWAPGLRRILVHTSGENDGSSRAISPELLVALAKWLKRARSDRLNEAIDTQDWETMEPHSFCGTGYCIVTTYENLRRNVDVYVDHPWSYVVLDEAQKIRNPDADITLACKRLRTPHRLAMSGTPIQNDLRELWSLFDFVFPGRLGTLPAFMHEFADPIKRGGYSNASPMQVQLAFRCALMLRDLVNPFLLRRQKKEVKEVSRMPKKTEHVLFCRLTSRQRAMYEAYLRSDEVSRVMRGGMQLLAAVTVLRKICNHPDLVCNPDQISFDQFIRSGCIVKERLRRSGDEEEEEQDTDSVDDKFVDEDSLVDRSGKLEVLSKILPLWNKQGHRVLIFCQWKIMLNIIQRFMMCKGWKFGRLDGNTSVATRQSLVDQFNSDSSYFALLCTTRTGGVGLNLTGANRIILYDPDFNPSTDAQARERAWRFGQEKDVTIYRLVTAGTIEEKIYQRQIFKTALSNKILQDPKQRRLFSQRDLHDLFSLAADTGSVRAGGDGLTDTAKVTRGIGVLDPESDLGGKAARNDDNNNTLRKVIQSKGLAGVFDHHYLEEDSSRKSITAKEMEEHAKRAAWDAAKALEKSLEQSSRQRYEPTWTGSKETAAKKFGSAFQTSCDSRRTSHLPYPSGESQLSSKDILASLRQRQAANNQHDDAKCHDSKEEASLLRRVKDFVRGNRPSTDEVLSEFKIMADKDTVVLRRLLQSVASCTNGRWQLRG